MNQIAEITHSGIIMWVVSFFFGGMGVYGVLFWFIVKGIKKPLQELRTETANLRRQSAILDEKVATLEVKKVDLVIYIDDKEKAEQLISTLETKERADIMRNAIQQHLLDRLTDMRMLMEQILTNQTKSDELRGEVRQMMERFKHIVDRVDRHIDGNK